MWPVFSKVIAVPAAIGIAASASGCGERNEPALPADMEAASPQSHRRADGTMPATGTASPVPDLSRQADKADPPPDKPKDACAGHIVHDGADKGKAQPLRPRFNVGYQVLDFDCPGKDGRGGTLTVAVWYPTATQPKAHNYGGRTGGSVAPDGEPLAEGAPYPLLVFSHGYGGGGLSAVFLAEVLAARGWIVACPDHHDKDSAVRIRAGQVKDFDRLALLQHAREIAASGPGNRAGYMYRLDEMKLALDGMLASERFGRLIDAERIAVGGHSFGGFAALGLAGTLPERRDPRVKALLLFSTGAGSYLYSDEELKAVRVPSMLFMGEREADQRRGSRTMSELSARIFVSVAPPKYFLVVRDAGHFSFNNSFWDSRAARALLSGTEEQFDVIRKYSIAFLEKHVLGKNGADIVPGRTDRMLTRCLAEPAPPPDAAARSAGTDAPSRGTGPRRRIRAFALRVHAPARCRRRPPLSIAKFRCTGR
ncbi:MAG: hypothetical protein N3A38_10850 [Planctomycetota bacterium]|nr:hypothetical protein [Planctomycetota bacterium]